METRQEKLIDGSLYTIELNTNELIEHFNNSTNCTNEILHQFNELSWYSEYLTENDKIILDLGGNIGLFAIHVTPWADRIITVEPTPSHFTLNEQLTSKFSNIERIQAAISNETGKIPFFTFTSNTTMNSLINRGGNHFMVDSITIPDLIEKSGLKRVDFIKLDIEGSETIALNEDIIKSISDKVTKILIEFHEVGGIGYTEQRAIFEQIFIKYGYEIKHFGPDGLYCYKQIKN
jgi:FkbM family methyltransferase